MKLLCGLARGSADLWQTDSGPYPDLSGREDLLLQATLLGLDDREL